ncbi:AfaD family invasin [Pantoea eucalypti]|uniref:AfaD family invasin n=1 Tax=Pantoea eucalypti TaxID=470933 RepID=UPI0024BA10B0|nr:AfaD family invasin [Pantoea eucalypti]MDJ0475625.1 AfaD family invasin [Pantoea eucalypti]
MSNRRATNSLLFILIMALQLQPSAAWAFQMKITPAADLLSGTVQDDSVLATIYFWEINDKCQLSAWGNFSGSEPAPGIYIPHQESSDLKHINVKLSGENWQPNTLSGKGVALKGKEKSSTLRLLTSGIQHFDTSILTITISATCDPEE